MNWLLDRWRSFFFEPASATDLGVCRILFYGSFFFFYLGSNFSEWAGVSRAFWMPMPVFEFLRLPVLPAGALIGLQAAWKVALVLSCLGLFTRVGTAVAFFLGSYLIGLPHNFGKVSHYDTLVVLTLGILAVSRCGDARSLDRLVRTAGRGKARRGDPVRLSGEYRWPIRAVWVVMALIFFGAGFSKLRISGFQWIFSDNIAILLNQRNYNIESADPLTSWGLNIASHPWLCRALAAITIAAELFYPLALISRRARWVIVPTVFVMQVGIRVLMGIAFDEYLICNLFWISWSKWGERLTRALPGKKSAAVVLDPR